MTTQEKKEKRASLKQKIEDTHDMEQVGQVWQWEACGVQGTDRCTICGLTHDWGSGGQNTGSFSSWTDARGNVITLGEASRLDCA